MPICPRCGKCLSSEQALTYHLNRKYRCGIWNCVKCSVNFNTKFQLQIHEMSCIGDRPVQDDMSGYTNPSTEMLMKVYKSIPAMIVTLDLQDENIIHVSPQCESFFSMKPSELVGKHLKTLVLDNKWKMYQMFSNVMCVTKE